RDRPVLALGERERPGDLDPEELGEPGALVVTGLRLGTGDQGERHVLDGGVELAASEADLAGHRVAGPQPGCAEDRVDRGGSDAEGAQHPFEYHRSLSVSLRLATVPETILRFARFR